ncbi:MAG: type II toxin-antitoxin system RelB/DinJ family antitoxin [Betaproteobacteria bacterium]
MLSTHKSTAVSSRIEPQLKEDAAAVLGACGLSLSDGIRLFLRQVVAQRGLPFPVEAPNATTIAAMKEARAMSRARFGTAREPFDALPQARRRKAR